MNCSSPRNRAFRPVMLAVGLLFAACASAASAHEGAVLAIGRDWWLPPNYSEHGGSIDALFNIIFWLTMVIFVVVEVVLIIFMVRYRHRAEKRKGIFSHGNTRLEMTWTLIPAVILIILALVTKSVWDNYRYNPKASDPNRAQILVIGQQFKWNVVYPGADGKLGRYLIFPKTTDLKWPQLPEGKSFDFPKVPGPAYMPEETASRVINQYIEQINPLGKDFTDAAGADDDWQEALARPVEIPKGRLVDVNLGSKDVIHDFFLPNFRVKLDAVPGMRGHLYFTSTVTSKQFEDATHKTYTLDELEKVMGKEMGDKEEWQIVVPPNAPGAIHEKRGKKDWLYRDDGGTIVRNNGTITTAPDQDLHKTAIARLRALGSVTTVEAFKPKSWDLVCEELCGQGHYTMQDKVIVLEDDAYQKKWGPKTNIAGTDPAIDALPAVGAKAPAALSDAAPLGAGTIH